VIVLERHRRPARRHIDDRRRRVLLVCSPGGHLQQLLALAPAWEDADTTWVTLRSADVEELLDGRTVDFAHGPTNRDLWMLVRNLGVAWRVIRARDPDVILSTGAGVAVPFFWVGRLLGRRCVFVESLARVDTLSLTGRLVYPFAQEFFVQWRGARLRRRARYAGSVL
jgi:UDP-N-acetylglucosamine:LPS N-acetylglucosamine transferase